jgi:CubicO group peptidase (beta-lactamase class C family)
MTSYRNADPRPPIMIGSPPELIVPRLDWDRPPWNRWAFQHIREILPTAEIWRGEGPVSAIPAAHQDIGRISFTRSNGASSTIEALLEETYTDGFMVIHRGRAIAERYFNGMTARTLHLSQSVAKSFVGTCAGILIGEGKLDPHAPVTHYLPELERTAYKGATVQQVLDMTSGVAFDETDYANRYSDIGQMDVASGWKPIPPGSDPDFRWPGHVWEQIMGLQACDAEHGSRFLYRSIETDVIAFTIERLTGKRLPQLVSELLWQPMGAAESGNFTLDPAGYALASGGLNATLGDYARFGLVHLGMGSFNGRQIVPKSFIADCRRGKHGLTYDYLKLSLPNGCYRNQLWVKDRQRETYMCRGVFGQLVYIAPEDELVVVKLSSYPDFLNLEYTLDTQAAIAALAAELA